MPFRKHLARGEYVLPRKVDVTPAKGAAALTPPGVLSWAKSGASTLSPPRPPPAGQVARWRVIKRGCFKQERRAGLPPREAQDGQKEKGRKKGQGALEGEVEMPPASALRGKLASQAPSASRRASDLGSG